MTPAEREFEAWWKTQSDTWHNYTDRQNVQCGFSAGYRLGLRAALSEHKRPLVAQQVADGVIKDWEGFYTGTAQ